MMWSQQLRAGQCFAPEVHGIALSWHGMTAQPSGFYDSKCEYTLPIIHPAAQFSSGCPQLLPFASFLFSLVGFTGDLSPLAIFLCFPGGRSKWKAYDQGEQRVEPCVGWAAA